jgi:hypothetical protein
VSGADDLRAAMAIVFDHAASQNGDTAASDDKGV